MPCLIVLAVLAFPRIVLLLLFFFSNYLNTAYTSILLPLLGFVFLPVTTIVYAWLVNSGMATEGWNLILLLIAVVLDTASWGGGAYSRRDR